MPEIKKISLPLNNIVKIRALNKFRGCKSKELVQSSFDFEGNRISQYNFNRIELLPRT